ncbi:nickel-dependent hydrogenase large subunit [Vreelandella rituensis]|uniref:Ni/Fe hydrogenase subunit alpha n=1 Tax=Vreelandella rituensis TaxID=2282306 RepID=A0A368TMR1_9GAMM|nr:nickel-dependent hydrogenase large subunit [Halomonas rituensis]RCV86009.1 Ni/Fe hydrogenase subunit alpha [Halomonas rituensis]
MVTNKRTVALHVPVLARVEGEGALHLRIRDGQIEDLHLEIYEPPRLFEKFLEGRSYEELPELVARICGICPVAYQMSAINAVESLSGTDPGPWVQAMRRLMYYGEWIQSHALHIHLLAAPDFFGYDSAITMAKDYPQIVRRGMRLQGLGNALIRLLGARSVHPVGIKVGGFHRAPSMQEATALKVQLEDALQDAQDLVAWVAGIAVPDRDQDVTLLSLEEPGDYPILNGKIASNRGQSFAVSDFEKHIVEHQVAESTALFSLFNDQPYLVGPLARLNLNLDTLPESVRTLAVKTGIDWPSGNMFHSMAARAIEICYGITDAIRILEDYGEPDTASVPVKPPAGVGYGATEAPRGLLWHRYELDEDGLIRNARIVPPTSQNQARIERDLQHSLMAFGLDKPDKELQLHCEQVIRNFDPCISCATHFLRLSTERL